MLVIGAFDVVVVDDWVEGVDGVVADVGAPAGALDRVVGDSLVVDGEGRVVVVVRAVVGTGTAGTGAAGTKTGLGEGAGRTHR